MKYSTVIGCGIVYFRTLAPGARSRGRHVLCPGIIVLGDLCADQFVVIAHEVGGHIINGLREAVATTYPLVSPPFVHPNQLPTRSLEKSRGISGVYLSYATKIWNQKGD